MIIFHRRTCHRLGLLFCMFNLAFLFSGLAANTYYADASNLDDTGAGTNWTTAKKTIQAAIDLTVAGAGDTVLVTNGVYNYGGRTNACAGLVTNRVVITNSLTVQAVSTNPANTLIVGAPDIMGGTPSNGPAAVRCVYLDTNCTLAGFTLTNGYTAYSATATDVRRYGGGAYCQTNAVVSNCVITACKAHYYGGGMYALTNSIITGCTVIGNTSMAAEFTPMALVFTVARSFPM